MRFLVSNGGNALRVWMIQEPATTLEWRNGTVAGLAPGVLPMARHMLELARHYGVLLVLVLFNGAMARDERSCSLFRTDAVMDALLTNAIEPLGRALRGYEHLAMYEIINEPYAPARAHLLHLPAASSPAYASSRIDTNPSHTRLSTRWRCEYNVRCGGMRGAGRGS